MKTRLVTKAKPPLPPPEAVRRAPLRTVRVDPAAEPRCGARAREETAKTISALPASSVMLAVPEGGLRLTAAKTRAGEAAISIGGDGRLGIGTASGDELFAINALAVQGLVSPFASLTRTEELVAVAARLEQIHRALIVPQPTCDSHEIRAAVLALHLALVVRAREIDLALHKTIGERHRQRVEAEPLIAVRNFAKAQALSTFRRGEAPAFAEWAKIADVSRPPYERWRKNGAHLLYYIDDAGSTRDRATKQLCDMGFPPGVDVNGWTRFTMPAENGALPIVIDLAPKGEHRKLFERLTDDDIDGVIYSGHAGYGQYVHELTKNGAKSTGEGKLIVLLQCTGIASAGAIHEVLPNAQLVSTNAMTYDQYDQHLLGAMVSGFQREADWQSIRADAQARLTKEFAAKNLKTQYFYPDQSGGAERDIDRDKDGVADERDPLYSFVTGADQAVTIAVSRVVQAQPAHALRGTGALQAIDDFTLVIRNANMLPEKSEAATPWQTERVISDGLFDPAMGETAAFRFAYDRETSTLSIALNAELAHLDELTLGELIAIDGARFFAAQAKLDTVQTAALALAFVERVRHQTAERRKELWRSPHRQHLALLRYGLAPAAAERVMTSLAEPEDFERKHYDALVKRVRAERLVLQAPRDLVGRDVWLGQVSASLPFSDLASVWKLPGTVTGEAPVLRWEHDGKEEALEIVFGEDNTIVAARAFPADFERIRRADLRAGLARAKFSQERIEQLTAAYDAARKQRLRPEAAIDRVVASFTEADGDAALEFVNGGGVSSSRSGWSGQVIARFMSGRALQLRRLGFDWSTVASYLGHARASTAHYVRADALAVVATMRAMPVAAVATIPLAVREKLFLDVLETLAPRNEHALRAKERRSLAQTFRLTDAGAFVAAIAAEVNGNLAPALRSELQTAVDGAADPVSAMIAARPVLKRAGYEPRLLEPSGILSLEERAFLAVVR
ncbi:MAG: hypothetical protein IT381_30515 [Deltaproteobacteria bacterium]|nr:hypothetical protein [Deltaproteobacteria bacterium]